MSIIVSVRDTIHNTAYAIGYTQYREERKP